MKDSPVKNLRSYIASIFDRDDAKSEPNPYHDWIIIFTVGFFSAAVVLVLNTFSFLLVQKYEIYLLDIEYATREQSNPEPITPFDRRGLEKVITLFRKKSDEHERFLVQARNVAPVLTSISSEEATSTPEVISEDDDTEIVE